MQRAPRAGPLDRVAGQFLWRGETLGRVLTRGMSPHGAQAEIKGKPKRVREKESARRGKEEEPMSSV